MPILICNPRLAFLWVDAMQQNRGVIERRQTALYRAFAQLLQQRDEADGVCRLMQKIEYDQRDIEDLLE